MAHQNNYKENEDILTDIVTFHIDRQNEINSVENAQCFIRWDIEGIMRALTQGKNIYDIIMTVYGARYHKKIKDKLKKMKKDKILKYLNSSPIKLNTCINFIVIYNIKKINYIIILSLSFLNK